MCTCGLDNCTECNPGEPVPHAIIGQRMTADQQRAWNAYERDHPQPPGTFLTAALVNQAIDWWNDQPLTRLDAGE